jgi:hypothetical protein
MSIEELDHNYRYGLILYGTVIIFLVGVLAAIFQYRLNLMEKRINDREKILMAEEVDEEAQE